MYLNYICKIPSKQQLDLCLTELFGKGVHAYKTIAAFLLYSNFHETICLVPSPNWVQFSPEKQLWGV